MLAQGKTPDRLFSYLGEVMSLKSNKSSANTVQEFLQPEHIQRALATRSAFFAKKVLTAMSKSKDSATVQMNEKFAIEVNRMVKLHLVCLIYSRACDKLRVQ